MKYKITTAPEFRKEFKALAKKYKSLKKDFEDFVDEMKANPNLGTSLGGGLRKIRLKITSKSSGKSGSARVISHELLFNVNTEDETKSIAFISIYDKSDFDTVDLNIIKSIVKVHREAEKEIQPPTTKKKTTPKKKK